MKRSRRIVPTLMGSAAVGAASMGFTRSCCGPGLTMVPGATGEPYCRPIQAGLGGTLHRFHGHAHGHAGG